MLLLKGTANLISSDPTFKEFGNIETLLWTNEENIVVFCLPGKVLNSDNYLLYLLLHNTANHDYR